MSPAKSDGPHTKKEANRGTWTLEEDQKLAQVIEIHGPKKWKSVSAKAGLNRCGKSCRLRWMNYLRPNIKRGNISDQEEDLILRLHKLLGNRWSLIAGRLPGRTDNEIKNYWNSHLSKKTKQMVRHKTTMQMEYKVAEDIELKESANVEPKVAIEEETARSKGQKSSSLIKDGEFFAYYTNDEPLNLEWMSNFLEMDESWFY